MNCSAVFNRGEEVQYNALAALNCKMCNAVCAVERRRGWVGSSWWRELFCQCRLDCRHHHTPSTLSSQPLSSSASKKLKKYHPKSNFHQLRQELLSLGKSDFGKSQSIAPATEHCSPTTAWLQSHCTLCSAIVAVQCTICSTNRGNTTCRSAHTSLFLA